jgi:8-oxo-dGTP diphosphatase
MSVSTKSVSAYPMGGSRAERDFLKRYDRREFLAPLTTVDMAIFAIIDQALQVLLVERSNFPAKGFLALPGGFVDETRDATLLATAHRKLVEKTGISSQFLEQVETVGSAVRDPRGWSITVLHFALIDSSAIVPQDSSNASSKTSSNTSFEVIRWMPVNDALLADLAFDHRDLLARALGRLRNKTRYTALPLGLMPDEFTLTELQHVFEIILGVKLEKKSFRRRLLDAGAVEETGTVQHGVHRPAAMYRVANIGNDFVFPRALEST